MQEVIDESTRRRVVQEAYNQAHDITPTTIYKSVEDVMLSTSVADARTQPRAIAEVTPAFNLANLDEQETAITLDLLRREMKRAAEALQFEEAAQLRDEILRIEAEQSAERAPS